MRRQEFVELDPGRRVAKAADQLALMIDNADARAEVGDITADRGGRAGLILSRSLFSRFFHNPSKIFVAFFLTTRRVKESMVPPR